MGGYTLSDIKSLPNPLVDNRYKFEIPFIPGWGTNKKLGIKCEKVFLPGGEFDRPVKEIMGYKIHHPGRYTYGADNALDVTYLEDNKMDTYRTIKAWMEMVHSYETNISFDKLVFSTIAQLHIYNQEDTEIGSYVLSGVFPFRVSPLEFSGEQANLVHVNVQFSFDMIE
jgi:hypothetical protein